MPLGTQTRRQLEMAIFNLFAQTHLVPVTGIEKDESVFTTAWVCDAANTTDAANNVGVKIEQFLNTAHSTHAPIAGNISQQIRRTGNGCYHRFFQILDLTGDPPSMTPIIDRLFTLGGFLGGNPMPPQVAVAISAHADLTGVPEFGAHTRLRQRRRSRFYLGPLTSTCFTAEGSTANCVLTAEMGIRLGLCAGRMADVLPTQWSVWSRADATMYPIVGGFIDNVADVVRRRRVVGAHRTNWS